MDEYDKNALQRLEEYLEIKEVSFSKLEKMAGLANGYIRKNKGSLSSVKLGDILAVLPKLNGHWLLTGSGEMEIKNNNKETASEPAVSVNTQGAPYYEMGRGAEIQNMTGSGNIENIYRNNEEFAIETNGAINPNYNAPEDAGLPELRKHITHLVSELHKRDEEIRVLKTEINTLKAEKLEVLEDHYKLTRENRALQNQLEGRI